jgi:hypothetical protein
MMKASLSNRFLVAGLVITTAMSMPLSALAKKAETKPVAKTQTTQTATIKKTVAKKEAKPVLDEATRKSIETASVKLDLDTRKSLNLLSESLHEQDRSIYNEIRDEEDLSLTDIGMLWEAAVERSGTTRFAIEKLSRRDATGKPVEGDNFSKRMLGSIVHLGGVAGSMWTGTPAGLIGSGMIQDIMAGSPQDSALSRVTDADMVLLAKQVEELQTQLIQLYYNYKHAKEKLALAQEAQSTINKYCDHAESQAANGQSDSLKPLMQSLVESARQDVQNAQQNLHSSRSALSGLVGPDAIAALDQGKKSGTKNVSALE